MKIDKITFKNGQAWVVIRSEFDGEYLGTWHVVSRDMVKLLREEMPTEIDFIKFKETEDNQNGI